MRRRISVCVSARRPTTIMEGDTRYVFGRLAGQSPSAFPTLVVVSPTEDGWRARSTNRAYNHDYVCCESFGEVMEWLDRTLSRPFWRATATRSRQVLLRRTIGPLDFFSPAGANLGSEEVERSLRHLETGGSCEQSRRSAVHPRGDVPLCVAQLVNRSGSMTSAADTRSSRSASASMDASPSAAHGTRCATWRTS